MTTLSWLKATALRIVGGVFALVWCIMIAACQDTVTGIFHHLAHQEPTVDGTLSNQLTVRQIARWDEQYLITAGKLWSRSALESGNHEWTIVTNKFNGSTESATLFPIVRWQPVDSTPMLVAGVYFLDDMSFALIQADDNDIGLKVISWTQVSDSAVEGQEVIALFTPDADESVLFAVIANSRDESRTYTLLSADTRSGANPVFKTELSELPQPCLLYTSDAADE